MARLASLLDRQLPDDLTALVNVEVIIDARYPPTVRAPDVVITHEQVVRLNQARLEPVDVLLAVEIISPGTARTDRVTKMSEYAEAGIAHYWLIDLANPPSLTVHELVAGRYKAVAKSTGPIDLAEPVPLTIDPAELMRRR
ncbi:Uma2 family endonuclease [Amycolatopsis rhizosphaerae]|uniref:Uma2 family endonuclease n=1 Tax=Amycolatopsis rhizosphaerae TaxID=2053003 RepID=A0A558BTN3_9PSEU|nr:Uma2 family endonuclease [Amycolatopsis rhizosphaerae]TVT39862.1 Uma2 family endonuclease [Amycolatopsis rhizosphaerae]